MYKEVNANSRLDAHVQLYFCLGRYCVAETWACWGFVQDVKRTMTLNLIFKLLFYLDFYITLR